jgi:RNA polymerase primary sigma factor
MHSDYISPVLRQLRDQQVGFAPREKKLEQANRAEQLLQELQPEQVYTYEYLCQRITDFKPTSFPNHRLKGSEVQHDLLRLVEDLSDAANLATPEVAEPVLTVEELSQKFDVSTKTVNRWRQQGLVGRRFVYAGRKKVGFLRSSVDRFIASNEERVKRGSKFSQTSSTERNAILTAARFYAQEGITPAEVIRRVANEFQRSTELIRYTIKKFDKAHPELAVFAREQGTLDEATKQKIYQQFHRGISIESLVKTFHRTRASIYRIVNEMRARRVMELPLDFMPNPTFARLNPARVLKEELPENPQPAKKVRVPSNLPAYLSSLYEIPLLTREQEAHLFRKFNYLKYRASRLREQLDLQQAKSSLLDEIEKLYQLALAVKNQIVRANLRLVVSIAKRHVNHNDNFFELVSDGNISLIKAVEKFDYAKGNKFSTYASWAIMKNFARSIPDEHKHQDRFRTSTDEMFVGTADIRSEGIEREHAHSQQREQIRGILHVLDEREQQIIMSRFGLNPDQESHTLQEVGELVGVTKERVRQIEMRALDKLRQAALQAHVEIDLPQ